MHTAWTKLHISHLQPSAFSSTVAWASCPHPLLWCVFVALPPCTQTMGRQEVKTQRCKTERDTIWCPVVQSQDQDLLSPRCLISNRPSLHACGLFLLDSPSPAVKLPPPSSPGALARPSVDLALGTGDSGGTEVFKSATRGNTPHSLNRPCRYRG